MATGFAPEMVAFGAVAALILVGFIGNVIFARYRLNDTLLLILVGVLVGPVSCRLFSDCLVAPSSLEGITPIVGPLALILILFDGGLALKFRDLAHGVGAAMVMAITGFTVTTAAIGALASLLLDVPLMTGLILGAIVGGTSAVVVLPSLVHLKTNAKTTTVLSLESAITDVLVVVMAFAFIAIAVAGQGPDPQSLAGTLVTTFIVSIVIGSAAGAGWLAVSRGIVHKQYGYMVTLGVMFGLYVLVQFLLEDGPGGGPLAVLAFGIVLGNGQSLGPWFEKRADATFSTGFKRFQAEIAFLVRTFFFVYLGILVDLDLLIDPVIFGVGLALFIALVASRYLAVAATTRSLKLNEDGGIMLAMMPRGLAAAVLAAQPAEQGVGGTESFVALAFLLLVLTNIATTVGTFTLERRRRDGEKSESTTKRTYLPRAATDEELEESKPVRKKRKGKKTQVKVVGRGLAPARRK